MYKINLVSRSKTLQLLNVVQAYIFWVILIALSKSKITPKILQLFAASTESDDMNHVPRVTKDELRLLFQ